MALTDTRLRNLKPTGTRFELPDRDGLALRVSQRGVMTWAVIVRVQGKGEGAGVRLDRLSGPRQRLTLGEYPTMSLAEAREQALAIKRLARAGRDPVETLRPKPKAVVRVQDLIERYVAEHLRRNMKAGANVEKLLRLHVSQGWGERELSAISRSDFVSLLEEIRKPKVLKVDGLAGAYEATRGGPGSAAEVRKWTRDVPVRRRCPAPVGEPSGGRPQP